MKIIRNFLIILIAPLLYIGLLGGLVAGIALALNGEWIILGLGLLYVIFGWILASIFLLPTILLQKVANYFYIKSNTIGLALTIFITQSYIYSIILGLSYMVFGSVIMNTSSANMLTIVLWSYAVATSPWMFLASKEEDNEATQNSLTITSIILFIAGLLILFGNNIDNVFALLRNIVIIPIIYTTWLAIQSMKNKGDFFLKSEGNEMMGSFSKSELIIFVLSALETAKIDNHLTKSETDNIRSCFYDLTGEKISKKFIKNIYDLMNNSIIDYWTFLSEQDIKPISYDFRKLIIKGCCQTGSSDNNLDPEEINFINRLGNYFSIRSKDLKDIISQYNT